MPTSTPKSSVDGLAPDRAAAWQRTYRIYAPLIRAWVEHFGVRSNDAEAMTLDLMLVILRRLPDFRKQSPTARLVDWMWKVTRGEIKRRVRSQLIASPKGARVASDSPTMPELPDDPPDIPVADRAVLLRSIEVARQRVAVDTMRAFELNVIQGLDQPAVAKKLRISEAMVLRSRHGVRSLIHQLLERIDLPESVEEIAPDASHEVTLTSGNLDALELSLRTASQDTEAVADSLVPWQTSWDQFLKAFEASDQAERMSLAADSIPGYRIKGWLGRGGMGEVYLARHMSLHRDVALKICAQSGWSTMRFDREMRLAGKLEHPNIVQTYDAGRTGQLAYIAMEHIVGNNLSQLVSEHHPLPFEVVAEILRHSLQALIHIHTAGIVHRDIKPSNIMLTEQGRVKLLDLGVAMEQRRDDQASQALTSTHHHLGTAAYAAPEQGFDRPKVGPLSDIYGLGCTAYFMLVGHHPYDGGTSVELYVKHRDAAIPDAKSERADVPPDFSQMIQRMMAKLPHDRPTAYELLSDLSTMPSVSLAGIAAAPAISSLFDSTEHSVNSDALISTSKQSDAKVVSQSRSITWIAAASLACMLILPLVMLSLLHPGGNGFSRDLTGKNTRLAKVSVPVFHSLSDKQSSLLGSQPDIKATLEDLSLTPQSDDPKIQALLKLLGDLNNTDVRTGLIHWVPAYVPLRTVIDCLRGNPSPHVRAALIQMLGVYEPRGTQAMVEFEITKSETQDELAEMYLNECNPEVHASLHWLSQRWGWQQRWNDMRSLLQQRTVPFSGGVYQPLIGPAMVIIPGPIDAQIGSPATESGRSSTLELDERLRTTRIPRSFAIANTEVTRWLYWRVGQRHLSSPEPDDPQLPQNAVQWQDAAFFCNQLSELEGIPPSEFCYEVTYDGPKRTVREFPDALERTGYRLPTDDEWEVAARAGTATARPFGNDMGWQHEYAVMEGVDSQLCQVASRKPNPNGLFDMLGNVSEWTNDTTSFPNERQRHARGGSVWTTTDAVRSGSRFAILERMPKAHKNLGFRVVRTLREQPLELPDGVELMIARKDLPAQLETASLVSQPTAKSAFDAIKFQQLLQFGTWKAGNVPTRRLRLVNRGKETLRINAKLSNNLFAFSPPPASELKPSTQTEFGIRVSANRIGECLADLLLETAIPGQTPRVSKVQISANVEGSMLLIEDVGRFENTDLVVDMGDVSVGARLGRDFQLINAGSQSTQPRVIDVSENIRLDRNINAPLAPSSRNFFHVTLDTKQPGPFSAIVRLHSSDAELDSNEIKIKANVIESNRFRYPCVFRGGLWLFNHNGDGQTLEEIEFGDPMALPLTGDWNGDGSGDLAVCKLSSENFWEWSLYLRGKSMESEQRVSKFVWGTRNDRPFAADIDGDGKSEFGLIRLHSLPRNEMETTEFKIAFDVNGDRQSDVEHVIRWGGQSKLDFEEALFFAGDIDGDHTDEILISRKPQSTRDSSRFWTIHFLDRPLEERVFGTNSQTPFVGDWNGDGKMDLGTAAIEGNSLRFLLNFDDDPYVEADIRDWAKPGDIPVTVAQ